MARKLALIFIFHLTLTLALPIPLSSLQIDSSVTSPPVSHASTIQTPQLHDKRYFFPETLPDKAELEDMLRETMRQAGFAPSSQKEPASTSRDQNSQSNIQEQKSHLDPHTEMNSAGASAQPNMQRDTKSSDRLQFQSQLQSRLTAS
ncbi:hypothetical protein N7535_002644 [Penicillium sp. DV-2018c]|nr:hypothetical protein N7535_002644 [Penicillium sp. DV-2018c]